MAGTTFNGRCVGITKAGTQCQLKVVYANGLCAAHGGDSAEYDRERIKRIIEVPAALCPIHAATHSRRIQGSIDGRDAAPADGAGRRVLPSLKSIWPAVRVEDGEEGQKLRAMAVPLSCWLEYRAA